MKKILLFSALSALSVSSFAQKAQPKMFAEPTEKVTVGLSIPEISKTKNNLSKFERTTSTPFATQTFAGGTTTSLPPSWSTSSSNVGQAWKWANVASTSAYSLGSLNSTTASDGWMIFDSDSLGTAYPTTALNAYLTSPTFNCVGHSSVLLTFEEYFRRFSDSCFVEVTNNNGTTWTSFRVTPNNDLGANVALLTNSYTVHINLTSVAANQANVKIRFHYIGPIGGGYSWMIDDLALTEGDPKDAAVNKTALLAHGQDYTSFSSLPLQFADSLWPVTQLSNNGATVSNISVTADIHKGSSVLYTQTNAYNNMAAFSYDSVVSYSTNFHPATTGIYTALFNASVTGDANLSNNTDSTTSSITDTLWSRNVGNIVSGKYVYNPTGGSSYSIGGFFDVPANKSDTLTGVSVAFHPLTTTGVNVGVQIYSFDPATSGWYPQGDTYYKTLTAADISTASGTPVYSYFPSNFTYPANLILNGGTSGKYYAAVVVTKYAASSSSVIVYTTGLPTIDSRLAVTGGVFDISYNDGSFAFGANGLPSSLGSEVPMVRLHFGHVPASLNANAALIKADQVDVYPNPANTALTFAYTLQKNANVSIKLLNTIGQTVKAVAVGNVTGNQKTTTQIATDNLANGVYFYTIEADGERITNRFVVQH